MLTQGLSTLLNVLRGLPTTTDSTGSVTSVSGDATAETGFAALFAQASAAVPAKLPLSGQTATEQPPNVETPASIPSYVETPASDVGGNALPPDGELLPLDETLMDVSGLSLPATNLSSVEDPEAYSGAPLEEAATRALEALGMATVRPTPSNATPSPLGGPVELPPSAVALRQPLRPDLPAGQPFNVGRPSPPSVPTAHAHAFKVDGEPLNLLESTDGRSVPRVPRSIAEAPVGPQPSARPLVPPAPALQANQPASSTLTPSSGSFQSAPAPAPDPLYHPQTLDLENAVKRAAEGTVKTALGSVGDDVMPDTATNRDLVSAQKPAPAPPQGSAWVVGDATPSPRVTLTSPWMPANLDQGITQPPPTPPVLTPDRGGSSRIYPRAPATGELSLTGIGLVDEPDRAVGRDLFSNLSSNTTNGTGLANAVTPADDATTAKAPPLTLQPEPAPKPPSIDGFALEVSLDELAGVDGELADSVRSSFRADPTSPSAPGPATPASAAAGSPSPAVQQSPIRSGMMPHGLAAMLAEPLAQPPDSPEFPEALLGRVQLASVNGLQEARLNLHPAELGRLTIHIATEGDATRIAFTVDNPQAREALEVAMPRLRELLADAGLQLTEGSVSERQQGQGQSAARDDGRPARLEATAMAAVPTEPTSSATSSANPEQLLDAYA